MSEGECVKVKNRLLQCKHCGSGQFVHRTAQLNTAFLEFLDLGWLNKSADIYACTFCGFLHWFLEPEIEEPPPLESVLNPQAEEFSPVDESVLRPGAEAPAPVEEPPASDDLTEPTECLECGQEIPAGSAKCPSCGWSYKQ